MIADVAERPASRLTPAQRHGETLVGAVFVAAAVALAALAEDPRHLSIAAAVLFVISLAVASRVEIQLRSGYAVPSELVVVPLILLVPHGLAAPLVAFALVLSRVVDAVRGSLNWQRVPLGICDAWFVIGPVTVLALAGVRGFHWHDWPWWCAAFGAQLLADTAASALSEWLRAGRRPRLFAVDAVMVWVVDAALVPIGLLVAMAAAMNPIALLMPVPLIALIAALAEERRARLAHALDLSNAYHGVALLLGEAIEADDGYTGEHTKGVVWLALAVADELGLDEPQRRLVEFGALLHDVGKITVPNEIINKPGPLSDAEWTIMKRHTIDGQQMLDKVGGVMADVGVIVRASHEHFNGRGYPDGLAGDEIPLAARIVSCADAFSAMTTHRSYRPAMSRAQAIAELQDNAGTQFDSSVVAATVRVVGAGDIAPAPETTILAVASAAASA